MRAFRRYTRRRFEPTHGDVLSIHTGGPSPSLSLVPSSFSLPSFFLHSLSRSLSLLSVFLALSLFCLSFFLSLLLSSLLFSLSLFPLLSSFSSLSATMTMITRPVGSLCVHTALTCLSVRVPVLWLIPCLANTFVSCKKQLSWCNCASLVPLGVKWACICAGNGCCVWWCL